MAAKADGLIGRDEELARRVQNARRGRLVDDITGPGGSGKTRLAQAVVEQWRRDREQEVVRWVDLAALGDGSLVPTAVLAELGIDPAGDDRVGCPRPRPGWAQMVMALDNCEHVVGGVLPVVDVVRRACPHVKILATSRVSSAAGTRRNSIWRLSQCRRRRFAGEGEIWVSPGFPSV